MRHAIVVPILALAWTIGACGAPAPSPLDSSDPTPSASSSLADARSATDLLECDGPPSGIGGRSDGGFGGTVEDDPDAALRSFLESGPFAAPKDGYRKIGAIGERHVYAYEVDDRIKVVLVFSPQSLPEGSGFLIEELRACAQAEWGGGVDLGPGFTVWAHEETGGIITDVVGWDHCDLETTRLLHIERPDGTLGAQYVRDPLGVVRGALLDTYAEGVDLPEDATFSGYRSSRGEDLWFTPDGRAAYVETADGIERWPRARDGIGCA